MKVLFVFILLSVVYFWPIYISAQEVTTKKILYYGWGIPDTQYVRDHWRQMENMPFDGVGVQIAVDRQSWQKGNQSTENQIGWEVMGHKPFQKEQFREAITDLKSVKWKRTTDLFLPVSLSASQSATGLNWFDDERWRIVENNFKVLAQTAAEVGAKGFIFDPEHYNYALFTYPAQKQQVDKTFKEYEEVVRRRGRQVMTAITSALPQSVIFCLYGYTLPLSELQRGGRLEETTYGLLPAFYDGMLEVMPSGSSLIDGYEFAYRFKERSQFLEGYHRISQEARTLSVVPDRYQKKVRVGFGLWLDPGDQKKYSSPEEFRMAIRDALEVSDGYVWIYSQAPRVFPPSELAGPYIDAVAEARHGIR